MIGVLLEHRYEIKEYIGSGSVADVYKAYDKKLSENIAIKILKQELMLDKTLQYRFDTEIKALSSLNSPYILKILGDGIYNNRPYIVMEYFPCINLAYLIKNKSINYFQTLDIIKSVLYALKDAHSAGIIHRDIKPDNILIRFSDKIPIDENINLPDALEIKLGDFGISKFLINAKNNLQTKNNSFVGSFDYMSFEQAAFKALEPKSDIYSLGIVFYELLTFNKPFSAFNMPTALRQRQTQDILPPSTVNLSLPKEIDFLIINALQPDINKRYGAEDMLQDIERLQAGLPLLGPDEDISEGLEYDIEDEGGPKKTKKFQLNKKHKVYIYIGSFCFVTAIVLSILSYSTSFLSQDFSGQVAVPIVEGANISNAIESLEKRGFSVKEVYESSFDVAEGFVISSIPAADELAPKNSEVILYISSGYPDVQIPSLVGLDSSAAKAALEEAGLKLGTLSEELSTLENEGKVLSSSPASGLTIKYGESVNITIGVNSIAFPNGLLGKSIESAKNELYALGFKNIVTESIDNCYSVGEFVQSISYKAGQKVSVNSTITLYYFTENKSLCEN